MDCITRRYLIEQFIGVINVFANVTVPVAYEWACQGWCIEHANCTGFNRFWEEKRCEYSTNNSEKLENVTYTPVTYFRLVYRCPVYYHCYDNPCKNGATCEQLMRGSRCICAAGWWGWFCESKRILTCQDQICGNGGTCYNTTHGINCTWPQTSDASDNRITTQMKFLFVLTIILIAIFFLAAILASRVGRNCVRI